MSQTSNQSSTYILYGGAAIVILGLFAWIIITGGTPGKANTFAQCITEKGAKMYGAWWCPHCLSQKKLFGKSFSYINYIECSDASKQMLQVCKDAGITGYPTWKFADGTTAGGEQSFEQLAAKTQCPLPVEGEIQPEEPTSQPAPADPEQPSPLQPKVELQTQPIETTPKK